MTPLPVATSFVALNARFRDACAKRGKAVLRGHTDTIAERMQADLAFNATKLGAISFDAVKMLLLAKLENRPARLDLTFYPYLPTATVGITNKKAYLGLMASSGATPETTGVPA